MKHLGRRPLAVMSACGLAAAGLALATPHAVFAGTGNASTQCTDGMGADDLPVFVSNPITLGLQVGSPALAGQGLGGASGNTYVSLCYATSSTTWTGPEITGGVITAGINQSNQPFAGCGPDTDAYSATTGGVALSCTVQPGGANGGQTLTVSIPFGVCVGQCFNNPGVPPYATGVIVGTIAETAPPPGGAGAAFTLSSLCVEVDGITLTCPGPVNLGGVTTTGHSPIDVGPLGGCGALVCVPSYVGLSGAQLATVYVPGTNIALPLFGEGVCLLRSSSGPPPSPDPCTS